MLFVSSVRTESRALLFFLNLFLRVFPGQNAGYYGAEDTPYDQRSDKSDRVAILPNEKCMDASMFSIIDCSISSVIVPPIFWTIADETSMA